MRKTTGERVSTPVGIAPYARIRVRIGTAERVWRGRIGSVSYNVAKAGLIGLVKTAASELGQYNVNVNLIAPGFIETDSQQEVSELIRDLVLKECAIKRLGQPSDIAPVVTFLCTEAAKHITGAVLKVDAGQYM